MADDRVRYYTTRPGAGGTPRRFWQPTAAMRRDGWSIERLPDDEDEALARARQLNRALDAWRRGTGPAGNSHAGTAQHPGQDPAAIPASDRMVAATDNAPPGLALPDLMPAAPVPAPAPPAAAPPQRFPHGSIGWLVDDWKAGPKWTAPQGSSIRPLAASTRRNYLWAARIVTAWADDGLLPVRRITAPMVRRLYERFLAVSHSKANAVVTVLRILLEHARIRGLVQVNVAARPGLISLPPRLRIWSHAEQDCMIAHADALGFPSIGDAILLGADCGQREGDILRMTRLRWQGGRLHLLRQGKTRALVGGIPATPRLAARLAQACARIEAVAAAQAAQAAALGRPAPAVPVQIVVSETTFARYGTDHFRRQVARIRAAAAGQRIRIATKPGVETMNDADLAATAQLAKCPSLLALADPAAPHDEELGPPLAATFSDLRDTCVTNLAEGGATIPEICAITGHSEKSAYTVLRHYLALNGAMAANAIAKLVALYDQQEQARRRAATVVDGGEG